MIERQLPRYGLAEERGERTSLRPLALQLLEERGAIHAQKARRLLLVAAGEPERLRDDPVLDDFHLMIEVDAGGAELPRHGAAVLAELARGYQVRRQIACVDHALRPSEDDHLLEHVPQLADV